MILRDYFESSNSSSNITNTTRMAQTFTASASYQVVAVSFSTSASSEFLVKVTITGVDGSGYPDETNILGTIYGVIRSDGAIREHTLYTTSCISLVEGTQYAIILQGGTGTSIPVRYHSSGTYPGGCTYVNSGSGWTKYSSRDLWFRVYGDVFDSPSAGQILTILGRSDYSDSDNALEIRNANNTTIASLNKSQINNSAVIPRGLLSSRYLWPDNRPRIYIATSDRVYRFKLWPFEIDTGWNSTGYITHPLDGPWPVRSMVEDPDNGDIVIAGIRTQSAQPVVFLYNKNGSLLWSKAISGVYGCTATIIKQGTSYLNDIWAYSIAGWYTNGEEGFIFRRSDGYTLSTMIQSARGSYGCDSYALNGQSSGSYLGISSYQIGGGPFYPRIAIGSPGILTVFPNYIFSPFNKVVQTEDDYIFTGSEGDTFSTNQNVFGLTITRVGIPLSGNCAKNIPSPKPGVVIDVQTELTSKQYAVVRRRYVDDSLATYGECGGDVVGKTILNPEYLGDGVVLCSNLNVPDRIYRSTDHGHTFTLVLDSGVSDNIEGFAVKGNEVLAFDSGGRIYYSGNKGASWELRTTLTMKPVSHSTRTIWKDNIVIIFAANAANTTFYACRSTNNGMPGSWSYIVIDSTRGGSDTVCRILDDGIIIAASANDIYRSTDGGQSFTKVYTNPSTLLVPVVRKNIIIIPDTNYRRVISYDSGATWTQVSTSFRVAMRPRDAIDGLVGVGFYNNKPQLLVDGGFTYKQFWDSFPTTSYSFNCLVYEENKVFHLIVASGAASHSYYYECPIKEYVDWFDERGAVISSQEVDKGVTSIAFTGGAPPVITSTYGAGTYSYQDDVTVGVTVEGSQPFIFEWYHNGQKVDEADSYEYTFSASQETGGDWVCKVSNSFGETESDPITVNVRPYVVDQSDDVTVAFGSRVELFVTVKGYPTDFQYQWYHNGEEIEGASSSSLVIEEVKRGDEGVYNCEASNNYGETSSDDITVSILYPSIERNFFEPPSDYEYETGQ